jgi:hypothetical protein
MANENTPFGLRPLRLETGGTPPAEEMSIASAYAANIFYGYPVQMTGTGTNIAVSEAGNVDNIGVFVGCRYVDANGKQQFSRYWPASTVGTDIVAYVVRAPQTIYECQCDTLAAADVGTLVDWDTPAGSTSTGNASMNVVGSVTGTAGKALRVLRLAPKADNAYGAYAKAEVMFVEHVINQSISGVGGV